MYIYIGKPRIAILPLIYACFYFYRSASTLDQLSSPSHSVSHNRSTSETFYSAFSSKMNSKKSEFIEMTNLPHHSHDIHPNQLPEAEGGDCEEGCSSRYLEEQVGRGHDFAPVGTFNPTWCDLCRDLVWGLYDTGATRCIKCHLTCHVRCQSKIRLNCVANDDMQHKLSAQSSFHSESTLSRSSSPSSSSTSSADELDHDESTLANISTLREEFHVDACGVIPPPEEFSDKGKYLEMSEILV